MPSEALVVYGWVIGLNVNSMVSSTKKTDIDIKAVEVTNQLGQGQKSNSNNSSI
jgi:hypothetical protein